VLLPKSPFAFFLNGSSFYFPGDLRGDNEYKLTLGAKLDNGFTVKFTFWFRLANKLFEITPFWLLLEHFKLNSNNASMLASSKIKGLLCFSVELPETIVVIVELSYLQFRTWLFVYDS
jgi:hypothetical protein